MDVGELLATHGIDPSHLEPAPAATQRHVIARICEEPPRPCTVCGEPSPTARIHDTTDGPRWVDLCRNHWLAVRATWRGPSTAEGIVADLRQAATQVGMPLTVYTGKGGWRD